MIDCAFTNLAESPIPEHKCETVPSTFDAFVIIVNMFKFSKACVQGMCLRTAYISTPSTQLKELHPTGSKLCLHTGRASIVGMNIVLTRDRVACSM